MRPANPDAEIDAPRDAKRDSAAVYSNAVHSA